MLRKLDASLKYLAASVKSFSVPLPSKYARPSCTKPSVQPSHPQLLGCVVRVEPRQHVPAGIHRRPLRQVRQRRDPALREPQKQARHSVCAGCRDIRVCRCFRLRVLREVRPREDPGSPNHAANADGLEDLVRCHQEVVENFRAPSDDRCASRSTCLRRTRDLQRWIYPWSE